MICLKIALVATALAVAAAQHQGPTTTPVPILKQINRQNDDGSYSFGYEAADGSFKVETKYPNGDVAGKYGYVDESGKTREISYGAGSKRGFEPQGSGINVPPPTLNESPSNALTDGQEDDGQYREDPSIYEDPKYNSRNHKSRPAQAFRQYQNEQPQYQTNQIQQPSYQQPQYQGPSYKQETNLFSQSPQTFPSQGRPQSSSFHSSPQFSYQSYTPQYQQPQYQQPQYQQPQYQQPQYQQPQYQQPQYQQPQYQQPQPAYNQYSNYQSPTNFNPFQGHPATNFDPSTGSYTINFTG